MAQSASLSEFSTEIDAVDVNPAMNPLASKRIETSEISVTKYVISGEDLRMEDSSYNYVACTFTFCSNLNV
jgi:ubiquinone/menaquinone biosynthesis C-methylase UbiE